MAEHGIRRLAVQLPQVVLMGNLSCRVEQYTRIIQFEPKQIVIEAVGVVIYIEGQELMLSSFTKECVSITGNISQVRYEK